MRIFFFLLTLIFSSSSILAQQFNWVEMGGVSGTTGTNSSSIATAQLDSAGNTIVVGVFTGTLNLGGIQLVSAGSYNFMDIYIAKYAPNGTCLWAQRAGGPGKDVIHTSIIRPNGDIYFTGLTEGTSGDTTYFGSAPFASNAWDWSVMFGKLDTNGNFIWVNANSPVGSTLAYGTDIAVDDNDNVYLSGVFYGWLRFNNIQYLHSNSNVEKSFLAKFTPIGAPIWVIDPDSAMVESAPVQLELAGNGLLYLINRPRYATAAGTYISNLMCFDQGGLRQWSKPFSDDTTNASCTPTQLLLHPSGDLIVNGLYDNSMTMDSISLVTAPNKSHPFLARITPSGERVWLRKSYHNSDTYPWGSSIFLAQDGHILEAGIFHDTIIIGDTTFIAIGGILNQDAFFVERDQDGEPLYAFRLGGPDADRGFSFLKSSANEYYIAGKAYGNVTFSNQTYTFSFNQNSGVFALNGSMFFGQISVPLLSVHNEEKSESEFSTHPNPTTSSVTFTYPTLQLSAQLTLTDAIGRTVFQQRLSQGTTHHTSDLSRLPEAVYFYRLATESGTLGSGKVAVVR